MNLFSMTCSELTDELSRRYGKGLFHAAAVFREVFKKGNARYLAAQEFAGSPALARALSDDLRLPSCLIASVQEQEVLKFASVLEDGSPAESVIIPANGRVTLCVSSQVGCRMGCRFCLTGAMGFRRNLSPAEIVWQAWAARFTLGRRIDNIVFMGMGEPLDNFDNVMQAVKVLSDQRGLDIAERRITISTAGHIEGIRRLAVSSHGRLRLAVSLNAPNNELRSRLMPINRKYPLEALKEELRSFPLGRDSILFIEYVLLSGVNDSPEHASELAGYLSGLSARVNAIAYNGGGAPGFETPSEECVQRFCRRLSEEGVFVCLRRSRGQGIMAACGQLGASLVDSREGGAEKG